MYLLKQHPEDFIVVEKASHPTLSSGPFALCTLKKRNYTTLRALQRIAEEMGKPLKHFSFAGTKDRNAVTEQYIAIRGGSGKSVSRVRLKDISLAFRGYVKEHLSLGELEGNHFTITVRGLGKEEIARLRSPPSHSMPNYFGEQRFSEKNIGIGRHLVKKQFNEALGLILGTDPDGSEAMRAFLEKQPNNAVEALRLLPRKLLKLYVHAYQSWLWNKALTSARRSEDEATELPLPGFGVDLPSRLQDLLETDHISARDFISRQMPELSLEGRPRATFVGIRDYTLISETGDTATVSFFLPPGSYATVAIAFLLDRLEETLKDVI